jgi:hypothetical protein
MNLRFIFVKILLVVAYALVEFVKQRDDSGGADDIAKGLQTIMKWRQANETAAEDLSSESADPGTD